ncbi:MAG: S8 family serine peptidase [Actinomycetota bacterium]
MGRKVTIWVACVLLMACLPYGFGWAGRAASAAEVEIAGDHVPGEVIVKFKPEVGRAGVERALSTERLAVKSENERLGFKVVRVPGGRSVAEEVARLSADPRVEYAEPNYIDHIDWTPNDPLFGDQWHMRDFESGGINAQVAWDVERGDPSVIVAVVDTGVAYEDYGSYSRASDLAGTSFVTPYDAVDLDGHPNDTNGHGTHVTGTIAQTTNNALGCAGAAHGCSIMPVRTLGTGGGSHAMMADGFTWATDHGADVINYSAGGSDSTTKRDACQYAYDHGVTICAAYGNNGLQDPADAIYPAAYDLFVVCVGATDRNKVLAWYSNYGVHADVVGPGGDTSGGDVNGVWQQTYVTEDDPSSGFNYQGWQGTSMATPHVSAAAALYISKTGDSDPDSVRATLQDNAHDLGSAGWDMDYGYGLVDAFLMLDSPPRVTGVTPDQSGNDAPVSVEVSGSAFLDGATVKLMKSGQANIPGTGVTIVSSTRLECEFDLSGAAPGAWNAVVRNPDGRTGTLSGGFTVVPGNNSVWYLAEGTTGWGFDTYVSIVNPNDSAVNAQVTYNTTSGPMDGGTVNMPPESRATVYPRDVLGEADFSTTVTCAGGKPIAVDRTMIWTGTGAAAAEEHSSIGVTAPATTWYLPEGSSAWGFETWLLIQNPGATGANCQVTYMLDGEPPITVQKSVPAGSRQSFDISEDIGQKDASIKVTSDVPVIPERAMYKDARREGHDSIGTTTPAADYYLAEGTTAWGFTTYVLVQNPQDQAADVTVTYMTPEGALEQPTFSLPANSRKTIRVNDVSPEAGYPIDVSNTDFSTRVHGTQPIIAERAMYWESETGQACHDSIGMSEPHATFYLPDGQVGSTVETWTLVQNPNGTPVQVEVTYLSPDGTANKTFTVTIPANSRSTFNMADQGVDGRAGIVVTCTTPGKKIMAERAMYFDNRSGGTDTIGGYSD